MALPAKLVSPFISVPKFQVLLLCHPGECEEGGGADHSLHDGHSGRPEWYMDCWDLHNNVAKTRKDLIINTIDMNVIDLMLCTELRVRHTKCSIIIKSVKKPVCKG